MHVTFDSVSAQSGHHPRVHAWVDGVRVSYRVREYRTVQPWRCGEHYDQRCPHVDAVLTHLGAKVVQRMRGNA